MTKLLEKCGHYTWISQELTNIETKKWTTRHFIHLYTETDTKRFTDQFRKCTQTIDTMWRTSDSIWVSKLVFAAGSDSKAVKHCVQISQCFLHAPLQSRDGSHSSSRLDSSFCTRAHSLKREWQSSEMTFEAQVGFIAFLIMSAICVTAENPKIVISSTQGVSACYMQWNKTERRLWYMLPGNVL